VTSSWSGGGPLSTSADQAARRYESNPLACNLKKYYALKIGYSTKRTCSQSATAVICINKQEFKAAETLKLLGLTIDSRLNFSEHVNSACKKASQRIAVFMRPRNLIAIKAKLQLYKTAVLPYPRHWQLVWHFCRASDLRKFERLQARGLRAVTVYNEKQASYSQIMERTKLPTLITDVCRTFVFLYIKLNMDYARLLFAIFLMNIPPGTIWGNLIFSLLGITL